MPETATHTSTSPDTAEVIQSLIGDRRVVFVLLSSSMVRQPFALATQLHLLDFEIAPNTTLLTHWIEQVPTTCGHHPSEIRIILAPEAVAPTSVPQSERVHTLRDRDGYRGPAGALLDACENLDADTLIVVLESARMLFAPLMPIIHSHTTKKSDITIVTDAAHHPIGITLTHRAMLDSIPQRGYIDLKEQWLNKQIEKNASVHAHSVPLGSSVQIRNRASLLNGMAQLGRVRQQQSTEAHPPATRNIAGGTYLLRGLDGQGAMATDGVGISGHPSAPGSYIMDGAEVDPSAVIARSVVFPGASVDTNEIVQDMLIGPNGCVSDEQFLSARRRGGRG